MKMYFDNINKTVVQIFCFISGAIDAKVFDEKRNFRKFLIFLMKKRREQKEAELTGRA